MIANLQTSLKNMRGFENTTWKVFLEKARNSPQLTPAEQQSLPKDMKGMQIPYHNQLVHKAIVAPQTTKVNVSNIDFRNRDFNVKVQVHSNYQQAVDSIIAGAKSSFKTYTDIQNMKDFKTQILGPLQQEISLYIDTQLPDILETVYAKEEANPGPTHTNIQIHKGKSEDVRRAVQTAMNKSYAATSFRPYSADYVRMRTYVESNTNYRMSNHIIGYDAKTTQSSSSFGFGIGAKVTDATSIRNILSSSGVFNDPLIGKYNPKHGVFFQAVRDLWPGMKSLGLNKTALEYQDYLKEFVIKDAADIVVRQMYDNYQEDIGVSYMIDTYGRTGAMFFVVGDAIYSLTQLIQSGNIIFGLDPAGFKKAREETYDLILEWFNSGAPEGGYNANDWAWVPYLKGNAKIK